MSRRTTQVRRVSLGIAVVLAIAAVYTFGQRHPQPPTDSAQGRHVLYYVDPMHPTYKSDKPGIAPDCGMRLEPVFAEDAGKAPQSPALAQLPTGAVSIDGGTQRLLGIRLAPVERSSATRIIRVVGRVIPEDSRVYRINSGADGFIRETYNDSVGMPVRKNQKLATYYAPEFLAAASGFLAASERVPGSVAKEGARSIQNYTDRLRNLGMSDVQIKQIADSRQLPESIDVVAPVDGFILARSISPGQHFTHEMEFYRIADLSRMWVAAEVYEQEALHLRPGAMAQLILRDEGRRLPARVTDSLPQSEAGGGTVKLRLEVDNPKTILRPEMLVDVELPVRLAPALTVPLDALIDSGERTRLYVERGDDVFEPREVKTGWRFGERVEILQGVQPGERVVVSATFLVDSESRLKTPAYRPTTALTTQRPAAMPEDMAAPKTDGGNRFDIPVDSATAAASSKTLAFASGRQERGR
jgi:membrane fusion protein, copper/silver efflux system